MKKGIFVVLIALLFNCCNEKKIYLPKSDVSVVKDVNDISKIDFFFMETDQDTTMEVHKNSIISTTNWVFNIDKRLTLKMIMPEIINLQNNKIKRKSESDVVKNNYFSYADTLDESMAFIPFTNVQFKIEKPKTGTIVYFDKNGVIYIDKKKSQINDLALYVENSMDKGVNLCFDKNMSYETYIASKLLLNSFEKDTLPSVEFIY